MHASLHYDVHSICCNLKQALNAESPLLVENVCDLNALAKCILLYKECLTLSTPNEIPSALC
jgi:hypothetical protein